MLSISHTTRPPRPGEVDGEHYHFVDETEFARLVDEGAFLEHAVAWTDGACGFALAPGEGRRSFSPVVSSVARDVSAS